MRQKVLRKDHRARKAARVVFNFYEAVTKAKDPSKVASLFSRDATLVGTVSQQIRSGPQIKEYFEYFAKLPGLNAVPSRTDQTMQRISRNVYLYSNFVAWTWNNPEDGSPVKVIARMTFLIRGNKIVQLHSSSMPERPMGLSSNTKGIY